MSAKESKAAARGEAAQDGAASVGPVSVGAASVGAAQGGAARGGPASVGTARGGAARGGVASVGAARDGAASVGAARGGAARDGAAQDAVEQGAPAPSAAAGSDRAELRIVLRDESHLRAHAADFAVPLDEALAWVRARLAASARREGWEHFDFAAPRVVGLGGLRRLWPWTRGDFWARRRARAIPSHLIVGGKNPTRRLCVWGFWEGEDCFVLHTLYPGRAAPREIHDPELALSELPAALRFWSAHAIVVAPGEWEA